MRVACEESGALLRGMEPNDDRTRLLLTISQAAQRLSVGRSTVYELTATDELELVHIGRCARIPVASVEEFVQRIRDHAVTKR